MHIRIIIREADTTPIEPVFVVGHTFHERQGSPSLSSVTSATLTLA